MRHLIRLVIVATGACLITFSSWSFASDEVTERRIQIGLSLFPNVIAIDEHIQEKLDRKHELNLVYINSDTESMRKIEATISNKATHINNIAIHTITIPPHDLASLPGPIAGIFIAEPLDPGTFMETLQFAVQNQILLFSPFIGDVERGATTGLYIEAKIKLYFNLATLRNSRVAINKNVLSISKHYE